MNGFRNEPHIDWTDPDNRVAMYGALTAMKQNFGKTYPIIIGDKEYRTSEVLFSFDPANKNIVGETYVANADFINKAKENVCKGRFHWAKISWEERTKLLLKTAEIVKRKKFILASLLVYEISKSWDEAMGEIEEAIDFLMLYACAALEYGKIIPRQSYVQAEFNSTQFIPRGITAAISTWNFPFSLSVEKIASSLAAGCPVLFKPAEQAPIIGWHAVQCFLEAGIPENVVAFLPGRGEAGNALVCLPSVTQISFTGSEKVGRLIEKNALESSGRFGLKTTDLEMGGNNSIIVCPSADLDEALAGIIRSKFSFNGQKCSALQRLILVGSRTDGWIQNFIRRLDLGSLNIGHPENPQNNMLTAVIDEEAAIRIKKTIDRFIQDEPKIPYIEKASAPKNGHFIRPIIFYDISDKLANHPAIQEEIFGPVLFILNVNTLQEAVATANSTRYGLTAGIYTGSNQETAYWMENIQAGNLYINRPIVGAMVDRQPFGGVKCSGKGKKVGQKNHLEFYLNEITVSANLLCRGLKTS